MLMILQTFYFILFVPGLLNVRPETMKLLEDKVRKGLQEIGAGKSFLNGAPSTWK